MKKQINQGTPPAGNDDFNELLYDKQTDEVIQPDTPAYREAFYELNGRYPGEQPPAGNDPATRNWIFRAYDGSDNLLKEMGIKDRTEDEARRECESYVEQSQTIEDWTLTPDPANEFKIGQTVYCNGKKDEVTGFVTPDDAENYAMGYRLILKDEGTQSFSAVSVTPPAGNDLPKKLKCTDSPVPARNSQFKVDVFVSGGDTEAALVKGKTKKGCENLAQEIVRRYNDFPALQLDREALIKQASELQEMLDASQEAYQLADKNLVRMTENAAALQEQNKELLEAIIELDKQCVFLHRFGGTAYNGPEASAAEERIKTLITKYSK